MTNTDNGRSPSGSGSRPTDEASISVESSPGASIPNAPTFHARLIQMREARKAIGDDDIRTELLERATYLHSLSGEGLSTIEIQSMNTMYRAEAIITLFCLAFENILSWTDEDATAAAAREVLAKARGEA